MACNTHNCPVTTTVKPPTTTTIPTTTTTKAPTTTTTTPTPSTTTPKPTTTKSITTTTTRQPTTSGTTFTPQRNRVPAPKQEIPIRKLPIPLELDDTPTASSVEESEDVTEDNSSSPETSKKSTNRRNIQLSAEDNIETTFSSSHESNVDFKIQNTKLLNQEIETPDNEFGTIGKDQENAPMLSIVEGGIEEEQEHLVSTKSPAAPIITPTNSEANLNPYHENLEEEEDPAIPTVTGQEQNEHKQSALDGDGRKEHKTETNDGPHTQYRHRHHHKSRRHHGEKSKMTMPKLNSFGSSRIVLNGDNKVRPLPKMNPALRTPVQSRLSHPKFKWTTSNWSEVIKKETILSLKFLS